ncbi:MAG: hypothetical protein KGL11_15035 [Alphaproteobacteria bacterium]|nr:hypothetical protein [Alphaproteobacteria bacterium]
MNPDQIKEKIRLAEEAVADMKDSTLKRTAFETVLSKLLGDSDIGVSRAPSLRKREQRRSAPKSTRPKPISEKTSSIKLDVGQLKALKEFYDCQVPEGTEGAVFALVAYLHEKLGTKKFHEADVLKLYQHLLPLKPVKKPPAMSASDIKRAMLWLVAPSRKKQWLERAENEMFQISSQGLLHISYGPETKRS